MIEQEEKVNTQPVIKPPVCSDYDVDCKDVESPMNCFIGLSSLAKNGITYHTPIADGICPLMNK